MARGAIALLVLVLYAVLDSGYTAYIQNRSQCRRLPFTSSPLKTIYPRKGEILVKQGWTLQKEAEHNPALKLALDYASRSQKYRDSVEPYGRSMGLNGNESLAVFCYTLGNIVPPLYQTLNDALRRGDDSSLPVFHYWLDSAVRRLVEREGSQTGHLYRGNSIYFIFNENIITFPGFTSTSKDVAVAREGFWSQGCTMMKITTHFGADITRLSNFTKEKEVLIPPSERFLVKGYTQQNGMPTVTMVTLEPVIRGGNGAAGSNSLSSYWSVFLTLTLLVYTI